MSVDPGTIVPNMIAGTAALVIGFLIIRFRAKLNLSVQETQKAMFGKRVAQMSSGRQTPFTMGTVGVGAMLIGLVPLGFAIAGVVQLLA